MPAASASASSGAATRSPTCSGSRCTARTRSRNSKLGSRWPEPRPTMKAPLLLAAIVALSCDRASVGAAPLLATPAEDAGQTPAPAPAPSASSTTEDRCQRVFSPVTGRVVRISAQVGQIVKRGDPLLTIAPPGADDVSTSEVRKAEANLIAARKDYERQKKL